MRPLVLLVITDEVAGIQLSVFPNPVVDQLFISYDGGEVVAGNIRSLKANL